MTDPEEILELLSHGGQRAYLGEPVSQLEHALQCAALAEAAGAPDALIVAALLHDIGHLVPGEDRDVAHLGVDARHEEVGDQWLRGRFSAAVTEPIRLHVSAKRYLCTVDPAYAAALSPASQRSLVLQGGPMTADETRSFERQPWAAEAAQLRRWDDAAKLPGREVAGLFHYRDHIARVLAER